MQPDFEKYADQKRFSTFTGGTWGDAFGVAAANLELPLHRLSLLDFGCGDGKYFKFLTQSGLASDNIHGVEVSRKRIERCHRIGWHNARLHEAGKELPYPTGNFDIVNMMEVIEHIPARQAPGIVQDIARVLRPGGFLLISTPNYPIKRFYDFRDALMFGYMSRLRDDPTHITFYNHRKLRRLLEPHFKSIAEMRYKDGFLYEKWPKPYFRHKILYLCRTAAAPN